MSVSSDGAAQRANPTTVVLSIMQFKHRCEKNAATDQEHRLHNHQALSHRESQGSTDSILPQNGLDYVGLVRQQRYKMPSVVRLKKKNRSFPSMPPSCGIEAIDESASLFNSAASLRKELWQQNQCVWQHRLLIDFQQLQVCVFRFVNEVAETKKHNASSVPFDATSWTPWRARTNDPSTGQDGQATLREPSLVGIIALGHAHVRALLRNLELDMSKHARCSIHEQLRGGTPSDTYGRWAFAVLTRLHRKSLDATTHGITRAFYHSCSSLRAILVVRENMNDGTTETRRRIALLSILITLSGRCLASSAIGEKRSNGHRESNGPDNGEIHSNARRHTALRGPHPESRGLS